MEYVADTVSKLIEEQKQQNIKRIYVISTYVIGKERLLLAVHRKTGCKIGVTQQKMDTLKCLDLPGKPVMRTNTVVLYMPEIVFQACCSDAPPSRLHISTLQATLLAGGSLRFTQGSNQSLHVFKCSRPKSFAWVG